MRKEENIYKLRKERGGKGTEPRREAGVGKGEEVTMKEKFKAVRDSRAQTRNIVIDSLAVGGPQSVKSHRMASLKTITIFATQKPRTARRPREKSLL